MPAQTCLPVKVLLHKTKRGLLVELSAQDLTHKLYVFNSVAPGRQPYFARTSPAPTLCLRPSAKLCLLTGKVFGFTVASWLATN